MSLQVEYGEIALAAWERYKSFSPFRSYCSILAMTGAARLGKIVGSEALLADVRGCLRPFLAGRVEKVGGSYGATVYRFGGNAAAWMLVRGLLPEAKNVMVASAELLCRTYPRDVDGCFGKSEAMPSFIWIDTVFGVCPFLLWTGKAAGRRDFIDESVHQMLRHHDRLFDPVLKLYHQASNAHGSGCLTPAHWSRGVGWGLLALAEMVYDLPKEHPGYDTILTAYRQVLDGCLATQDGDGMWHQAMEAPDSYVESSGSALILYAIGRGLKNGSIDRERFHEPYIRGMRGLSRYVSIDGSVFNACCGCLAPGAGTVADYAAHPHKLNDEHSSGPVIYAFSQAEQLRQKGAIPPLGELLRG